MFTEKIASVGVEIQDWIAKYNLNNLPIINEAAITRLLAYLPSWITEERKLLGLMEDAITKASATYEERNSRLAAHATTDTPAQNTEAIAARLAEVTEIMDASNIEGTTISLKLQQHANNKNRVSSLEATIALKKAIYENWQKLNELIGSADGKKFRQFAQEYTLDILLGFSNAHLKDLAQRYKLSRVPNTLALQVIDRDMGDEIRSVHSLSGGESFLVSLALALGLSSLSSNKMKVESLFIDEGFGSLDPATLLVAMEALEKLQGLGRKVGVISHVHEMTERITTQIKIVKVSGGRSKVEVR